MEVKGYKHKRSQVLRRVLEVALFINVSLCLDMAGSHFSILISFKHGYMTAHEF